MTWPLSQDYNEAVQNPRTSFADPDLRAGRAAVNALGLPMPRSGNFADVYEIEASGGARWAVKCFTREVPGLQARYGEISRHLARARLPFLIDFTYLPEGIRVRGRWYPVLKMPWVEGLLLNAFVRDNLDRPDLLAALSQIWLRLAGRLRAAGMAHADLQHGNVILVPGRKASSLAVKLIDYDGTFVPALAGRPPGEAGHPAYQHPARARLGLYDAEVDRLPLLAVACAVQALAVGGRPLWDRHDNGDNLLFREADLRDPGQSPLFRELWNVPDAAAHDLTGYLTLGLLGPPERVPLLTEVMTGDCVTPLTAEQERQVAAVLGEGYRPSRMTSVASEDLDVPVAQPYAPPPTTPAPAATARPTRSKTGRLPLIAAALVLLASVGLGAFVFGSRGKAREGQPAEENGMAVGEIVPLAANGEASLPEGNGKANTPNWVGPWDHLEHSQAQDMGEYLHLPKLHRVISTKAEYSVPFEVTLVARTENNNIRLHAGRGAAVIFNWEGQRDQLRVHWCDGTEQHESGTVRSAPLLPLEPNAWHTLRWVVLEDSIQVWANGRLIWFTSGHQNDTTVKAPLRVYTVDSDVDVKLFDVDPPAVKSLADTRWGALTLKMKDLSNWERLRGDWSQLPAGILGKGDSLARFRDQLPAEFVLFFDVTVLDGMRPRVHFDQLNWFMGNEGYVKQWFVFGPGKRDLQGVSFKYAQGQKFRVRTELKAGKMEMRVDDLVIATANVTQPAPTTLTVSGGDWWSRGTTAYTNFRIFWEE